MASPDEVKRVWNLLAINYPSYADKLNADLLKQQLALWQRLLVDVPGEVLQAAALQHMAVSKWFPAVSELRDQAGALTAPPQQAAIEAWGEVTAAMASARYYRYADGFHEFPQFADPVTQKVVDSMGWGNLCGSEDGTADRARFLQGYEAVAKRAQSERLLLPIVRELTAKLTGRNILQLEADNVDRNHAGRLDMGGQTGRETPMTTADADTIASSVAERDALSESNARLHPDRIRR